MKVVEVASPLRATPFGVGTSRRASSRPRSRARTPPRNREVSSRMRSLPTLKHRFASLVFARLPFLLAHPGDSHLPLAPSGGSCSRAFPIPFALRLRGAFQTTSAFHGKTSQSPLTTSSAPPPPERKERNTSPEGARPVTVATHSPTHPGSRPGQRKRTRPHYRVPDRVDHFLSAWVRVNVNETLTSNGGARRGSAPRGHTKDYLHHVTIGELA